MKWRQNGKMMEPEKPMVCSNCGTPMILRWSKLSTHGDIFREVARREKNGEDMSEARALWNGKKSNLSYVDDQRWKCPDCHFTIMFGIPISFDQYWELYKARGKFKQYQPIEQWLEDETIKQRLQDLGYF